LTSVSPFPQRSVPPSPLSASAWAPPSSAVVAAVGDVAVRLVAVDGVLAVAAGDAAAAADALVAVSGDPDRLS
jgi:hypothetical protein